MHNLVSSSRQKSDLDAINVLFFKADVIILKLRIRKIECLIYLIESWYGKIWCLQWRCIQWIENFWKVWEKKYNTKLVLLESLYIILFVNLFIYLIIIFYLRNNFREIDYCRFLPQKIMFCEITCHKSSFFPLFCGINNIGNSVNIYELFSQVSSL